MDRVASDVMTRCYEGGTEVRKDKNLLSSNDWPLYMTDQMHVQESLFSADYGIKFRRRYMIASMFVTFIINLCSKYCFSN